MTDRPILFSGPMVRALLDGTKTQTRRILKPQPDTFPITHKGTERECFVDTIQVEGRDRLNIVLHGGTGGGVIPIPTLIHNIGDRLWVREHWRTWSTIDHSAPSLMVPTETIQFEADHFVRGKTDDRLEFGRHRQSIHMPRWASRTTLVVTDVRVQRLQDISREDAIAEGLNKHPIPKHGSDEFGCDWTYDGCAMQGSPISTYAHLWNSINGDGAWDQNPWINAITFTVHKCNIDKMALKPDAPAETEGE